MTESSSPVEKDESDRRCNGYRERVPERDPPGWLDITWRRVDLYSEAAVTCIYSQEVLSCGVECDIMGKRGPEADSALPDGR